MRAFSAPGKALVAGGYLVLEPQYPAFVVALSARIHAVVKGTRDVSDSTITVHSPQFAKGVWSYRVNLPCHLEHTGSAKRNKFVEAVIRTILCYFQPECSFELSVTIFSDDEYHSQAPTQRDPRDTDRFHFHSEPIDEVPKTGLGSSAALCVALTTALASFFDEDFNLHTEIGSRPAIHNLSQIAHCVAQGKIGSGFDVAAAVFGSLVYQRFCPSLLHELVNSPQSQIFNAQALKSLVQTDWQMNKEPCRLPDNLDILMGDVKGGSESPKLVSIVQSWRTKDPSNSAKIWQSLNEANLGLISLFKQEFPDLDQVKKQLELVRKNLKRLTVESQAPVEPDIQTRRLDACVEHENVIGAVVPGAGGYDAICLIVEKDKLSQVSVDLQVPGVQWLDLEEDSTGIQEEDPAMYPLDRY